MHIADIDECADDDINNCEHDCENTDGSYTCSCVEGFLLAHDEHSCHGMLKKFNYSNIFIKFNKYITLFFLSMATL